MEKLLEEEEFMNTSNEERYKCPCCDGHGEVDTGNFCTAFIEPCGNCEGKGTVDWVRNIRPRKYNEKTMEWE